jgi:hypothetical protein
VTTLAEKIASGRKTTAKATAAYAATKTGIAMAKKTADQIAHVWRVENYYADDTYEAAMKVAGEQQVKMIGARDRSVVGDTHLEGKPFKSSQWVFLKGIAPGVQARKPSSDAIEFRAFRLRDLFAIQEHVAKVEAELEVSDTTIDIDFEPSSFTSIYSWHAKNEQWQYMKERPSRTFKSVVVPEELQAEIEADLKRFSDSRHRLQRLEMPWRRGYLLSGPPGTGKTSMSLAIAGCLSFNLASLSLTDISSDGTLRKAVSSLPMRTVLVIEDIDANAVSHERDHNAAQDGALSLSGLLNALDGFETPEGLVTILTTNHIERLDAALIRSGRMDRTFDLGHIAPRELERLFAWFYEQEPPSKAPKHTATARLSPADVAELFKQHLDDPEGGWKAVTERAKRPVSLVA